MTHLGFIASCGAAVGALGFAVRLRFWLHGARETNLLPLQVRLREFFRRVIVQESFRSGGWRAPLMHGLLFWGVAGLLFCVAVTALLARAPELSARGSEAYSAISFFRELAALAFLIGSAMAIQRRYVKRWIRLPFDLPGDSLTLGLLLGVGLTGVLSVAARLALNPTPDYALFIAAPIASGLRAASLARVETLQIVQIIHAVCVAAVFALMPFTRLRHICVSPLMLLVALRNFEIDPTRQKLSWAERMQLDACSACGRCDVACTSARGSEALSPLQILLAQRTDERAKQIHDGALQNCTLCGDCETACPIAIAQRPRIASLQSQRGLSRSLEAPAQVA